MNFEHSNLIKNFLWVKKTIIRWANVFFLERKTGEVTLGFFIGINYKLEAELKFEEFFESSFSGMMVISVRKFFMTFHRFTKFFFPFSSEKLPYSCHAEAGGEESAGVSQQSRICASPIATPHLHQFVGRQALISFFFLEPEP